MIITTSQTSQASMDFAAVSRILSLLKPAALTKDLARLWPSFSLVTMRNYYSAAAVAAQDHNNPAGKSEHQQQQHNTAACSTEWRQKLDDDNRNSNYHLHNSSSIDACQASRHNLNEKAELCQRRQQDLRRLEGQKHHSIDSGLFTDEDQEEEEEEGEDQQHVFEDESHVRHDSRHGDRVTHLKRMDLRIISLSFLIILNQSFSLSSYLFESVPTIVTSLIIALASFGASFGLRKMYVKALLRIFQYATNIKHEKTQECEELLQDDANKSEIEKRKELARLIRRRHESFMLHPSHDHLGHVSGQATTRARSRRAGIDEEDSSDLEDIDKQNNNYLADRDSPRVHTKSATSDECEIEGSDAKRVVVSENKSPTTTAASRTQHLDTSKNRLRSMSDIRKDFQLGDIIDFVHKGIECIIDDDVTKRFTTEELTVWNLLSRTNQQYEYISFRVTVLWLVGLVLRYGILFPFRLVLFIFACSYTFFSTLLIGFIKDGPFKRWLNWYASLFLHRILSRVFSAIITFHNRENRAKPGSICVANHTSPIDVIILSTDNCYAMIGQTHGGFTGMMQSAFSRAGRHIWFDRSEAKDRSLVAKRMHDHVQGTDNMPILIFPEGTCINNTSVMMFKKGCFEVDTTIYPVAIKYDLRFGDAFWNSSQHTMLQYLMLMMTSWAIVVDVYYLPPMDKLPGEDATAFASRVKAEIVKKGSFVDLNWDGMLKRSAPKLDLMYEQQQRYVSQLKID